MMGQASTSHARLHQGMSWGHTYAPSLLCRRTQSQGCTAWDHVLALRHSAVQASASVVHHNLTEIPSLIGSCTNASMVPLQNIRSKTAIYYLFSNNHLNEIVAMRFDFDDDEVSR